MRTLPNGRLSFRAEANQYDERHSDPRIPEDPNVAQLSRNASNAFSGRHPPFALSLGAFAILCLAVMTMDRRS